MTALADWRGWRPVSAILAPFIAVYFAYFAITRPAVDWDVVPYTMAILKGGATSPDGAVDIVALHANTWATIRPHVSPEGWAYLTTDTSYAEAQHLDPMALFSQLPLYESKYGYILLLKARGARDGPGAGDRHGEPGERARHPGDPACTPPGASTASPRSPWLPLVLLFGLGGFASMVSPDAVFTFAYVAGVAALLSERARLAVFCFLMAALLRPDGIVLNVFLCGVLAFRRHFGATPVLLAGIRSQPMPSTCIGQPPCRLVAAVPLQLRRTAERADGLPAGLRSCAIYR